MPCLVSFHISWRNCNKWLVFALAKWHNYVTDCSLWSSREVAYMLVIRQLGRVKNLSLMIIMACWVARTFRSKYIRRIQCESYQAATCKPLVSSFRRWCEVRGNRLARWQRAAIRRLAMGSSTRRLHERKGKRFRHSHSLGITRLLQTNIRDILVDCSEL